jgi:hypothetical protein
VDALMLLQVLRSLERLAADGTRMRLEWGVHCK